MKIQGVLTCIRANRYLSERVTFQNERMEKSAAAFSKTGKKNECRGD